MSVPVKSLVAYRIRVRPSRRLLSDLSRPCGSLTDGKPAFDKARHIKSFRK